MKTRRLGRTGLQVSEVGFGCWAIGGSSYGPTDDGESLRALSFAFDQGINFFDTADTYGEGHSESLIGEVFKESSKRLKAVIATKVGFDFYHGGTKKNFDPDYIRFACTESLKRLRTDYIDLYQLHNPKLETIRDGSVFKVLDELRRKGHIRNWGVSIFSEQDGAAVIENGTSSAIQAIYNLIDQRARKQLMPLCERNDVGLIIRVPLYYGLLTGKYSAGSEFVRNDHRHGWAHEKFLENLEKVDRIKKTLGSDRVPLKQAAIEFVLHERSVSVVIPGMKTVSHVEDHLQAANRPLLTADDIQKLQKLHDEDELFQKEWNRVQVSSMSFTESVRQLNIETTSEANHWFQSKHKVGFPNVLLLMVLNFLSRYFLKGGWRDGYQGFMRAVNSSLYPLMSYAKLWELVERERGRM